MFENEVEYFAKEIVGGTLDLKESIWQDDQFKDYLLDIGVRETLYELTSFARSIQVNLQTNNIHDLDDPNIPDWARKATKLLSKVKSRRQQIRRVVRDMYGEEAIQEIQARVDAEVED